MRIIIAALSCALTLGSGAVTLADYYRPHAETPLGVRLGSFYLQYDYRAVEEMLVRIDSASLATARAPLIASLDRDAGSAARWCDAGAAFLASGDRQRADYSYLRAAALAPRDANILYAAGIYYARLEDPGRAVPFLAAVLSLTDDRTVATNVFQFYERLNVRQKGLLEPAIPNGAAAREYLRYMIGEDDLAGVREIWNLVRSRGYDDDRLAMDDTEFLLRKKQLETARGVWAAHFSGRNTGNPQSSLLFNGGFEYELTGSALDWQFEGFNGVTVDRDRESRYEGGYSLRIAFAGNDNPDFHHLKQLVVVRPGHYHFEAQMRTDRITSDQGPRFVIRAFDGKLPMTVETSALSGTNSWKQVTADFEVPSGVHALEVQLVRHGSIRIDNQLTGTAWIDAVVLTRLQ